MESGGSQGRVLGAFIAGSVLAGGNGVAIRFSNRELAPMWGATLRFALAALLLGAVMTWMRLALPRGRALTGVVLYGLLTFGAAFALAYYALQEVQAGLGQILLALVPLLTLLLAILHGQESLRPAAVAGTVIGLIGIALATRGPIAGAVPVLSLLAVVLSAACFAEASVIVHGFPRVHPVVANAVGMAVAAAALFALSLVFGESRPLPRAATTINALVYLVVIGSTAVFVLYVYVLQRWEASRAAYSFLLVPIVTVLVSSWLDDEAITGGLVVGGALVLIGVYVGALRGAEVHEAG